MKKALKSSFISWYEYAKAKWYLVRALPAEKKIIRAYTEFKEHLAQCDQVGEHEYAVFQEILRDSAQLLGYLGREAIMITEIPSDLRQMFLGASLGCSASMSGTSYDPGIVPLYRNTCEQVIYGLWKEEQRKEITKTYKKIYFLWLSPRYLTGLCVVILLGLASSLTLSVAILLFFVPHAVWIKAVKLLTDLLSSWHILGAAAVVLISCSYMAGIIIRKLSYPRIQQMTAVFEERAVRNEAFFLFIVADRQTHSPFSRFWEQFFSKAIIHFVADGEKKI